MKKRIFAVILAALMVVPFGMLSAFADTASVPAEPTATGTKTYYISNGKTGSGETADAPANTNGWLAGQAFAEFVAAVFEYFYRVGVDIVVDVDIVAVPGQRRVHLGLGDSVTAVD